METFSSTTLKLRIDLDCDLNRSLIENEQFDVFLKKIFDSYRFRITEWISVLDQMEFHSSEPYI